jgi:hypothetical protein
LPVIASSVFRRSRVDRAQAVEPRDHEHVAGVELGENAAQLGAVGLRAARGLAPNLLRAGRAQLLHLCIDTLAVGRYSCVAPDHGRVFCYYILHLKGAF